jgi:hypothetical protein
MVVQKFNQDYILNEILVFKNVCNKFYFDKKKELGDSSVYRFKSIRKPSYFFWEQQKSLKKESIDGLIV